MKELPPIKESQADFEALEKAIKKLFLKEVYYPLMRELGMKDKVIQNENDALKKALLSGQMTYYRGSFSGRFNSRVSKELKELGAQWDRNTGTWKILQSSLPMDVRNAVSASLARFDEKLKRIDEKLSSVVPEALASKLKSAPFFDRSLWKVEKDFKQTLKNITIVPELNEQTRKKIADEWQDNMKLWIKNFTEEEIKRLRKEVKESTFSGNRYESLIEHIQKSYNVTAKKAKFLARQETSLLMTKFKEDRYIQAGVIWYRWGCVAGSPKHPVRPWHKALEGKTFRWDDPPVTTEPGTPSRRNNPGQDYNCRCFARPLVRFKE